MVKTQARDLYDVLEDGDKESIVDDEPYQQNESYGLADALRVSDDFMALQRDIPQTFIDANLEMNEEKEDEDVITFINDESEEDRASIDDVTEEDEMNTDDDSETNDLI
ncbi:hypothetical protein AAC387_Pa06g2125 [Persea americana]